MNKIFPVIGLAVLSASCAAPGPALDGCEGLGWPKSVTVRYGDDGITFTPKKNIRQKSVLTIYLKPKKDYRDKVVKIVGKSVSPGGAGVKPPSWLNKSDSYNTTKKFVFCTPALPDEKTQEYTYSIDVGGGLLFVDPRIHVTN